MLFNIVVINENDIIKSTQIDLFMDSNIGTVKAAISRKLEMDINNIYLFYKYIDTFSTNMSNLQNIKCIMTNVVEKLDDTRYIIEVPLGMNPISIEYTNWIANPYKYSKDIPYAKIPTVTNFKCLLNGGANALDQTIYVCQKENKIHEYFTNDSLNRFNKIFDKEKELFNNWKNDIDERYQIDKIEAKIKNIKIEILRGYFIQKKEDILSVFKSIHASPTFPIIKYNPSNINRLIRLQLNTSGDELYWEKYKISKIIKELNTNKTVSIVFDTNTNNSIYCELIESTGNIAIQISLKESLFESDVDNIIEVLILNLNRQLGFNISQFNGIKNSKIIDMELELYVYGNFVELDLSKINCNASFGFLFDKRGKNIFNGKMFRVPDFNILDELKPYVRDSIKKDISQNTIVHYIEKRYNLSKSDATEYYLSIYRESSFANDVKVRAMHKLNDGIQVTIEKKLINASNYLLGTFQNVKYYQYIDILANYLELIAKTSNGCNDNLITKAIFIPTKPQDKEEDYDEDIDINDIYNYDDEEDNYDILKGGVADVDGFNIVNFMQNRIEKYDKKIVLKHNVNKFKPYSSSCQSSDGRQPIALTDEELNNIKENAPHFLNDNRYVSYKTEGNVQTVHYICPRYWDLKNNLPLSSEDIKGMEEHIIPRKSNIRTATNDKYILEISDMDGQIPSFQIGKHPDSNVCLPCCFKKTTNNVLDKLDRCNIDHKVKSPTNNIKKIKKKRNRISTVSISERKILPATYISLIPPILQKIIYPSQDFSNITMIPGLSMLMKRGVHTEEYTTQSFLSSIADALWSVSIQHIPDVEKLKNLFNSITLDEYLRLNNGDLLNYFSNKNELLEQYDNSIHNSIIYNQLVTGANELLKQKIDTVFSNAVASRNNFLTYIHSKKSVIDYKFIWSYIVKLFPSPINLVILSINENDNLTVICPTDKSIFDKTKDCLFLIEYKGDFSPIYKIKCKSSLQCSKDNIIMDKLFKPNNTDIMVLIDYVIIPSINKCIHKSTTLLSLQRLIKYFDYKDVIIQTYNITTTSVVGILVSTKNAFIWIPCIPSPPLDSNNIVVYSPELIRNIELVDYNNSVRISDVYYKKTNGELNYRPKQMMVDSGYVFGYISESNIYIPCAKTALADVKNEYMKEIKNSKYETQSVTTGYLFGKDTNRINFMSDYNNRVEKYKIDEEQVIKNIQEREINEIKNILNNNILKQQTKVYKISIIIGKLGDILNQTLIADKIVRNKFFQNKIIYNINDKQQLKISNYSLNENEIIVLESWFLQPTWSLRNISVESEDNVLKIEPLNSRVSNDAEGYTTHELPDKIKSLFPEGTVIRNYTNNWYCMMDIFQLQKKDIITILENKYKSLDTVIIYNHFNFENKQEYVKLLKNNFLSFHDYLYSNKYILTLLDYLLLFNNFGYNIIISILNDDKTLKQFNIKSSSFSDKVNNVWIYINDRSEINVLYNYDNLSFDGNTYNAVIFESMEDYFNRIKNHLKK
jgi:hypothetical protein